MRSRTALVSLRGATALVLLALLLTAAGCDSDNRKVFVIGAPGATPTATPAVTSTPTPTATPTGVPFVNFGVAVVGDDGNGFTNGLQVMTIEDSSGSPLPTPQQTFAPLSGAGDIDGLSITADGTHGAVIDGGNTVFFFTADLKTSKITLLPATVVFPSDGSLGRDGDSIASLPGGDEVVVSAGSGSVMVLINGVLSGSPAIVGSIPTSGKASEYDGVVISEDGKVMLGRSGSGDVLDVYSVAATTPRTPSSFAITKTFMSPDIRGVTQDGREGMAISPTDSSRAVLVSTDGTVQLFTGLPAAPIIASSLTLSGGVGAQAVTITRDGKFAIVATTTDGLAVVGGVDTGTLAQVGADFHPTFSVPPSGSCTLDSPRTLGAMADGKFIVAIQDCGLTESSTNIGSGVLLTIPISSTGALSAPVGQLNFVVAPDNDQLLVH